MLQALVLLMALQAQAAIEDSIDVDVAKTPTKVYVAIRGSEKNDRAQLASVVRRRAADVCAYLGLPAGNWRTRRADKIRTQRIPGVPTSLTQIDRVGGKLEAKTIKTSATEKAEKFTRFTCIGKN